MLLNSIVQVSRAPEYKRQGRLYEFDDIETQNGYVGVVPLEWVEQQHEALDDLGEEREIIREEEYLPLEQEVGEYVQDVLRGQRLDEYRQVEWVLRQLTVLAALDFDVLLPVDSEDEIEVANWLGQLVEQERDEVLEQRLLLVRDLQQLFKDLLHLRKYRVLTH